MYAALGYSYSPSVTKHGRLLNKKGCLSLLLTPGADRAHTHMACWMSGKPACIHVCVLHVCGIAKCNRWPLATSCKGCGRVHISDSDHIEYCHFYFVCGVCERGGVNPPMYSKQKQLIFLNHNSDSLVCIVMWLLWLTFCCWLRSDQNSHWDWNNPPTPNTYTTKTLLYFSFTKWAAVAATNILE